MTQYWSDSGRLQGRKPLESSISIAVMRSWLRSSSSSALRYNATTMVEINMYLFLQEPSLLDLTEDLFHDMCTSVEPEFEIPDEVCEIDNSLDHD